MLVLFIERVDSSYLNTTDQNVYLQLLDLVFVTLSRCQHLIKFFWYYNV